MLFIIPVLLECVQSFQVAKYCHSSVLILTHGTLVAVLKPLYHFEEINECEFEQTLCGNGMCMDEANDDGLYSCDCDGGYEETGDPATLCQTCTGR